MIVTVDELAPPDEVAAAGIVIPTHLVAAVTEVPFGAHPSSCYPRYSYDSGHLREYVTAAQAGPEDVGKYLAAYVCGTSSERGYREAIGADRLSGLAAWSQSTSAWKELFARVTLDEWFVVLPAWTIRSSETVFHGFGSPCAQVAMHVARRTHAPDMMLVEGATYAVNPEPLFIPPTSNDASLTRGAAYTMRFEEFFDAAMRGDVDRAGRGTPPVDLAPAAAVITRVGHLITDIPEIAEIDLNPVLASANGCVAVDWRVITG